MRDLLPQALLVWLMLLVLAVANGALRELVLVQVMNPAAAEVSSALLLVVLIALGAWLLVRWTPRRYPLPAWLGVGALWVGLTAAFELGVFHYVLGAPWQELLADYDPRHGYFGLVQLTALLAPAACAAAQQAER